MLITLKHELKVEAKQMGGELERQDRGKEKDKPGDVFV